MSTGRVGGQKDVLESCEMCWRSAGGGQVGRADR